MTIKLHIGANETPYPTGDKTTAEVAKILNDKYGVFDQFAADHAVEIGDMVGEAMLNAIFRMGTKHAVHADTALRTVSGKIRTMLERDIVSKKFDRRLPGVPTAASLEGIVKYGRRKNTGGWRLVPGRPSFVESMLLLENLRVWFSDPGGLWGIKGEP